MLLTKSIVINQECISELIEAMADFSASLNGPLTKEQCYTAYLLQQLYVRLRTKQNRMFDTGKEKMKMKFDSVQALVLVDILQQYRASMQLNKLLMELGSMLPSLKK